MRWSKEKTLLFIEQVRNHRILWDPKHVQRNNKLLKNYAWKSIALMENTDVTTCKGKWASIQASFRREKSNIKRKSIGKGPDEHYQSRWYAYKYLQFMLDRRPTHHTHSCTIASNMETVKTQTVDEPCREQKVTNNGLSTTVQADANKQLQMETDVIIKCWLVKYCKLARDQRFYADKIAIDVLYEGELGRLSQDCAVFKSVTSTSAVVEHQQLVQASTNNCYLNYPQSSSFNSDEASTSFVSFANTNQVNIEAEAAIDVKNWAVKYSRLAQDQRLLAEKIINDILFQGSFGTLTLETTTLSATPLASSLNESTGAPISTNGSRSSQTGQSPYPQHNLTDLYQKVPNIDVSLTYNSPEVFPPFPCLVDINVISPVFLDHFQEHTV